MKNDVIALIDTYATGMQIAMWGWFTALLVLHLAAAGLVIAIARRIFDRVIDAFARAHQTIADIQQPDPAIRKESQQS